MEEMTILSSEEIDNLFTTNNETQESLPEQKEEQQLKETKEETTEIDAEKLFESESVSSEEDNKEKESTTSEKDSTSPNNFYSSIATALMDSTFPDLDTSNIKDADSFAESFEKLLQSRLDDRLKRIDEALNNGVEPSAIKLYEDALNYLNSIKEEDLSKEDSNAETLRKNLIIRDLLNKGYSLDEAKEELSDIFANGNDIKKAERALRNNINYYQSLYDNLIKTAKEESNKLELEMKALAEALKKDILSNNKAFGDLEISLAFRLKAYDAISKPIYKDESTGEYLTAIQKYEMENRLDFLKNLGLLFVLTDNFKNLDNLVKGKVNKASRKALTELENKLNNTSRTLDGNLKFISGTSEDPESIFKSYTLDI